MEMSGCKGDFEFNPVKILEEDGIIPWTVFWTFARRIKNSNLLEAREHLQVDSVNLAFACSMESEMMQAGRATRRSLNGCCASLGKYNG
jgi:hypothetical protein